MTAPSFASRRSRAMLSLIGAAGLAALGACNGNDNEGPIVNAVVATFRDTTVNFGSFHTFVVIDSVVQFAPLTGAPIPVTRQFDQVAIDQVRADLISRGFTEAVNPTQVTPDLVVIIGATASQNYQAWISYPWFVSYGFAPVWGFAPFDNSWGIIYPWGPVVGVTTYAHGTLIVDMISTRSVNPLNKSINSVWAGAAVATLDGAVTADNVTNAINQMFALSPYLTTTP